MEMSMNLSEKEFEMIKAIVHQKDILIEELRAEISHWRKGYAQAFVFGFVMFIIVLGFLIK